MPSPLIPAVRSPPQYHGKDRRKQVRHRRIARDQTRIPASVMRQSAKYQGHPQIDDINANLNDDVNPSQQPHRRQPESIKQMVMLHRAIPLLVLSQLTFQPSPLLRLQPVSHLRAILQHKQHRDSHQNQPRPPPRTKKTIRDRTPLATNPTPPTPNPPPTKP